MIGGRRALVAGTAVVVALAGAASAAAFEPAPEPSDAPLVEVADCAAPLGAEPVTPTAGPGQTVVSFSVPAQTSLRVVDGDVVAAATNSGCAPRPTDRFRVGRRPATGAEVDAALDAFTSGDWRAEGVWHPAG